MKNFFYTEVTSPLDQFEIRNLLSLDGLLYNFCILLSLIIIIVIIARTFGQGFELIKSLVQIFFSNFTLAKFLAAFTTIVSLALVKYYLTGGFTINPKDIVTNVSLGFLGWGANIGITSWFTDFLGIKGINFNLRELLYGYDKMADGSASPFKSTRPIDDLTCHMNIEDSNKDKGKTVEIVSGSTTPTKSESVTPSDVEYWESQARLYRAGLSSLNKADTSLTQEEHFAKQQLIGIGEYSKEQMRTSLNDNISNISMSMGTVHTDPEAVRMEEVRRNTLMSHRNKILPGLSNNVSEGSTQEPFNKTAVSSALNKTVLSSALKKLSIIKEYNVSNHTDSGFLSPKGKLTSAELECIINTISQDPDAPTNLKNRINVNELIRVFILSL